MIDILLMAIAGIAGVIIGLLIVEKIKRKDKDD